MDTKLNKSDYILLGIFYTLSSLFQMRQYYTNDSLLLEYLVDIPATTIVSVILLLLFLFWLIPNYIVNKRNYVLFIVFGLLLLVVFGGLEFTLGFWSGGNDWQKFPPLLNFLISSIDFGGDSVGFPLGLLLTKKFYEGRSELANIQKQQKENELKLLRSQLDPHFLFNNLNTLDALIDSNPNKAKEYINRLSLIYRYLIQTKDAEVMELAEEMNLAENYLFLIKTRFGNDYDITIEKNTAYTDKFIPTGALQTLLENVVKHNKVSQQETIKTQVIIDEDWLTVVNAKSKVASNQESFGTGLENLKTRYTHLSDKAMIITATDHEYKIAIPIIKLEQ